MVVYTVQLNASNDGLIGLWPGGSWEFENTDGEMETYTVTGDNEAHIERLLDAEPDVISYRKQ